MSHLPTAGWCSAHAVSGMRDKRPHISLRNVQSQHIRKGYVGRPSTGFTPPYAWLRES